MSCATTILARRLAPPPDPAMAFGIGPDEERQQDEVLSRVDALLRRHRSGGLDAILDGREEAEIPTLTEIIDEAPPSEAHESGTTTEPMVSLPVEQDTQAETPTTAPPTLPEPAQATEEGIERIHAEIERVVADALARQLPQAIQEQVMPEVMLHLGEGLNRLRDAMRATVRTVVQETIEQEVKRALKALLKEREQR